MSISNIALSGLRAASSDLQVTGNNIANAGTFGFKESRMEFSDIMSTGALNSQVGNGVQVSGVTQDFSVLGFSTTGGTTDMAISGEGFFVTRSSSNNAQQYTRAGNFKIDKNGNMITQSGDFVQGYQAVNGAITSKIGDIQVPKNDVLAPKATNNVTLDINLDASDSIIAATFNASDSSTYNYSNSLNIYDSLGGSHNLDVYYTKSADNNWDVNILADGTSIGSGSIVYTDTGTYQSSTGLTGLTWSPGGGAAPSQTIDVNVSKSSQYGGGSTPRSLDADGYPTGQSGNITISSDGIIQLSYSNGETKDLAQVAKAKFSNPQGLYSVGDSSWKETSDSGSPLLSMDFSTGAFRVGALENSNVELTEQLVKLISAQRAFQANSQSIRAGDVITQTVINLE